MKDEQMIPEELMKKLNADMMEHIRKEQANKLKNFRILNSCAKKGGILFTGSSLMEQFPVCELAMNAGITVPVYNRGIGGTTTDDFLREINTVLLELEPAKVFLNIGTNDMTDRIYGAGWKEHLAENYESILRIAREKLPNAQIYCMAYYPTNSHLQGLNEWQAATLKERTVENITVCNESVRVLAEQYGCCYIDANAGLTDENGEQKAEFSIDGVHMFANAYQVIFENLKRYLS